MFKRHKYGVLDVGSYFTRIGFGGSKEPSHIFRTIVGRRRSGVISPFSTIPDVAFGNDVISRRVLYHIYRPVFRGTVRDWNSWKALIRYSLETLNKDLSRLYVILPYNLGTSNREKLKMAEILLEELGVGGIYFPLASLLVLYATGEESGIIVDIGEGKTTICPVEEGIPKLEDSTRINLGGYDITLQLLHLLRDKGISLTMDHIDLVSEIKEKCCYVAVNVERELEKARKMPRLIEEKITLPDGTTVALTAERFLATEILFNPTAYGVSSKGLHEVLYDVLSEKDVKENPTISTNIILSGGTSLLPGIAARLKLELEKISPELKNIKIKKVSKPTIAVWYGGSVLTLVKDFEKFIVTRKKFRTQGEQIIYCML